MNDWRSILDSMKLVPRLLLHGLSHLLRHGGNWFQLHQNWLTYTICHGWTLVVVAGVNVPADTLKEDTRMSSQSPNDHVQHAAFNIDRIMTSVSVSQAGGTEWGWRRGWGGGADGGREPLGGPDLWQRNQINANSRRRPTPNGFLTVASRSVYTPPRDELRCRCLRDGHRVSLRQLTAYTTSACAR